MSTLRTLIETPGIPPFLLEDRLFVGALFRSFDRHIGDLCDEQKSLEAADPKALEEIQILCADASEILDLYNALEPKPAEENVVTETPGTTENGENE